MKDILEKYPWISYNIDLTKMPYSFWFLLGQCVSKCSHIRQIPLLPENRDRLHLIYLAKGLAATTAIEGNTLGEEKVLEIIEGRADIEASKQYQQREIENILEACNKIAKEVNAGNDFTISIENLRKLNRIILSGNIPIAEGAVPGEIRKHPIVVGNVYRGPDAQDVYFLLEKFCDWINKLGSDVASKNTLTGEAIAIIKAIAAHLYLVWIHPFGDGNGRLARLVEFSILLKSGIPSIAAHLLSNHYNSTRTMYYQKLKEAKDHGPVATFFQYAVEGFQDNLKTVIETIIEQVLFISWQHYVYEKFREMPSGEPIKRQRDVLIEISNEYYKKKDTLSLDEIEGVAAKIYVKSGKTKVLKRDLRFLTENDFLEKRDLGFVPKFSPVLRRLPFSN
jgi:Fic family protein